MPKNSDFTKFLTSVKSPGDYRVELAPGLHQEIANTHFSKVSETVWMRVTEITFTHPMLAGTERDKLLDHYRLFVNELYLILQQRGNEFCVDNCRVVIDELYLKESCQTLMTLIEQIISGDWKYSLYLNAVCPEHTEMGERFIMLKIVTLLHQQKENAPYVMQVGHVLDAFTVNNDGTATLVKSIYDTVLGLA